LPRCITCLVNCVCQESYVTVEVADEEEGTQKENQGTNSNI